MKEIALYQENSIKEYTMSGVLIELGSGESLQRSKRKAFSDQYDKNGDFGKIHKHVYEQSPMEKGE